MTEKKQKSFVLYADFESALLKLSIKERGILFTMIFSYVNRGEIDEILTTTPLVDMAFEIIRAQLDRDREKYEAICERNAKNGRNGGRPKGETETQKTQWVFEKPKKPYNDNDIDNGNGIDIENENDIVIDKERDDKEKEKRKRRTVNFQSSHFSILADSVLYRSALCRSATYTNKNTLLEI